MTQGGLEVESEPDRDVDPMAASSSGSKIDDHRDDGDRADEQSTDGDEVGANQGDEDGALDAIDVVVNYGLPTFQHPDGQLLFWEFCGSSIGGRYDDGKVPRAARAHRGAWYGLPAPQEACCDKAKQIKQQTNCDDAMKCGEEEARTEDKETEHAEEDGEDEEQTKE